VVRPAALVENPELWGRVAVTLAALVIYRLGTHLPVPGLDLQILNAAFGASRGAVGAFSGSAFLRLSIFSLGITPYVTASFCVLLLTAATRWQRKSAGSRKDFDWLARVGALALAVVGGYAVAIGLENAGGQTSLVPEPGSSFRLVTMATVVAGTAFLMWLADQITRRGIGNGVALILFTDTVARLPSNVRQLIELGRAGRLASHSLTLPLALFVASVALIVFMERAQRRLLVQYKPRLIGTMMFEGEGAYLRFKLNNSGIIPAGGAVVLLLVPAALGFPAMGRGGWPAEMAAYLAHGSAAYILCSGGLILLLAFVYTALLLSPKDMADRLQGYGGVIAGHEPGQATADYLDHVLTRLTLVGAVYVAAICLLPEVLISLFSVPFYFGGIRLLVTVCVALDVLRHIEAHVESRGR
jgi:preprotein translocase subunit SecY